MSNNLRNPSDVTFQIVDDYMGTIEVVTVEQALKHHALSLEQKAWPVNFWDIPLDGMNLSDRCFKQARLVTKNYQLSDLKNADFQNCDLGSANFKYCNLEGADFSGSDLTLADFTMADLSGTKFKGANLDRVIGNGKEIVTFKPINVSQMENFRVVFIQASDSDALELQFKTMRYFLHEWVAFTDEFIFENMKNGLPYLDEKFKITEANKNVEFWKEHKQKIILEGNRISSTK
jgi:uncharacterized protein YjbI with pentapeptide repeats